jgi:hypothetical protein
MATPDAYYAELAAKKRADAQGQVQQSVTPPYGGQQSLSPAPYGQPGRSPSPAPVYGGNGGPGGYGGGYPGNNGGGYLGHGGYGGGAQGGYGGNGGYGQQQTYAPSPPMYQSPQFPASPVYSPQGGMERGMGGAMGYERPPLSAEEVCFPMSLIPPSIPQWRKSQWP